MLDLGRVMEELTRSGVPQQELERAQQHAAENKVHLLQALADLNIADYSVAGKCLAEVCRIPYRPLLANVPSPHARGLLSPRCAHKWKVFPHAYQPDMNLLTLAVHDPDQVATILAIHNFFMQPFRLAFTIAPVPEIEKAFEMHLGITPSGTAPSGKRPLTMPKPPAQGGEAKPEEGNKKPAVIPEPGRKMSSLAEALKKKQAEKAAAEAKEGGAKKPAENDKPKKGKERQAPMDSVRQRRKVTEKKAPKKADEKPEEKAPEKKPDAAKPEQEKAPATDLSHSLISAAALLVGAHLGDNSEELARARSRVRYCQLLGTKLGFPTTEIDQVVLGAWMSALKDKRQVIKQFVTPYNLDEVIFTENVEDSKLGPAAQVLKLVTCYQEMKERDPTACKDVNLTRRSLRLLWSSAADSQPMLETFLQLLMDEEFLSKLDNASGKILIVDPVEVSTSSLGPPLTNDGYDVNVVPTAAAAEDAISESAPDLVIAAFDLPQTNGLKFCQKLKRATETSTIPVIILLKTDEEEHVAECLRAGVDDYIVKPLNLELLFLKTQKLVATSPTEATKEGVSGTLEDMSFTDMIQILCAGAKSMEIDLNCDGTQGQVFVKAGEIIHATVGKHQGEAAFYELMKWTRGEFTTKQCADFPEPTIDSSTMSLLMEGARLADEGEEES